MWLQRFSGLIISLFLGIFDGLGFKSVAWVVGVVAVVGSNWFDGLCVCGSIDGLVVCVYVCGFVDGLMVCVFVCVCVYGSMCVVMGLIGVSWVSVCVWICVLNQC